MKPIDWSQEDLYITLERYAEIRKMTPRSIRRFVRLGRFRPMPVSTRPMRFSRADCEAEWTGEPRKSRPVSIRRAS